MASASTPHEEADTSQPGRRCVMLDLPTELGGSCASFLTVNEMCTLKRTSRKFGAVIAYGMGMPRDALIVPSDASQFNWSAFDRAFQEKRDEMLRMLFTLCPRARSIRMAAATSENTERLQYYEVKPEEDDTSGGTPPLTFMVPPFNYKPHPELRLLASLPLAKRIESLRVVLHDNHELGQSYANKFESLRSVQVVMDLYRPVQLERLVSAWPNVAEASLRLRIPGLSDLFECDKAVAKMLCALRAWHTLREINVRVPLNSWTGPPKATKDALGWLVQYLPHGVERFDLSVYFLPRGVRDLRSHTTKVVKSRFPKMAVKSKFTVTRPRCLGFRVWFDDGESSNEPSSSDLEFVGD